MKSWSRVAALSLTLAGIAQAQDAVTLMHVHGLAYSPDGKRLMIPSHHGLALYENGKWAKAPGPQHDYMGFSATAENLYSSGHSAPGSGMVNPFGLIRSKDGGKTWDKLALEGETDFHVLGASWNTNAIYVWNPAPSSRLREPGLHYTLNDGVAWARAQAAGLKGELHALAVHPDKASTMAAATSTGIYLSRDSGNRFTAVSEGSQGLAALFDLDGKHLWYGVFDGQPRLVRAALGDGKATQIKLPALAEDAVAYVAQNPVARKEYAIATFRRSVYVSKDAGRTWSRIADRGKALSRADPLAAPAYADEEIRVLRTRVLSAKESPAASHALRLSLYAFHNGRWSQEGIAAAVMTSGRPSHGPALNAYGSVTCRRLMG